MNVLEKILEEIKDNAKLGNMRWESIRIEKVEEIIRSHKDEVTGDGWIPVSERLPEPYKLVEVTVHCSEWISDYDSVWIPENEKIHHDEEYLSRIGYTDEGGDWLFYDKDGCEIYYDKEFGSDKTDVYNVVTAWRPLPEPYKGGE